MEKDVKPEARWCAILPTIVMNMLRPGQVYFCVLRMLTPSGRFEINKRICLSMSDFHKESGTRLTNEGCRQHLQGLMLHPHSSVFA